MVARIAKGYTNDDARVFDPALRRYAPAIAQYLFEQAQPNLSANSTLANVEFNTECRQTGSHGSACRICLVTVRRCSDGPNGDDVVSAYPERIGSLLMEEIIRVHNLAYAS